jgi:cytochrome c biogenesis protein CcmG/thiol:disulfide interchange protein DsbE
MNKMTRRFMLLAPLGMFALGGFSFYVLLRRMGTGEYDPRGVPSVLIDRPAPAISLVAQPAYEGISAGELAAPGRPVLVNFFASWCLPCVAEAPQLLALARRGVTVWGVAYKDKVADTEAFLKRYGNPFARIVRDEDGKAGIDFGLYGVPETYFLDKTGIVRWRWVGPLTDGVIAQVVDPLLRKYA